MRISPFTPLFHASRKTDGIASDYVQTFAPTDLLLIEILCSPDEIPPSVELRDALTGKLIDDVGMSSWKINNSEKLYFAQMSFNPGYYQIVIDGMDEFEPFRVTNDPNILRNTTLIQYSMKDNKRRDDAVFFIDGMQYFFDFRVPGGFKDSGWSFGAESDQFVRPDSDIVQLYGMESTARTFTLGTSMGVPVRFAELLNRLLVCSHVYFDGVKYVRKESSVPEMQQPLEGVNSFVFTQALQQALHLNPLVEQVNHAIIRRVNSDTFRITDNNDIRLIDNL